MAPAGKGGGAGAGAAAGESLPILISDLFQEYELDYQTLSTSIKQNLNAIQQKQQKDQWQTVHRALERELDEANEILASMENELYGLNASNRSKLQPKFQNYKSQVSTFRSEFNQLSARSTFNANAREELGIPSSSGRSPILDQKLLSSGTDRLQATSDRLTNTQRVALETEQSGIETLQELRRQREQLERARSTLRDVDSNVDRASRTLRQMLRRASTNKLITFSIVFMLVILIIMVIILKFR